jgi:hypothetical protein
VAPLLGILLAGVTIWLKTSQGTLKIESDVDDVTVETLNERDQVRELKIKKGKNEIVLEAGEYRVRLAGTHDGVDLDRDVITLRRGDETMAKITRVAKNEQAAAAPVIDERKAPPVLAERLYQGKPESEWKRHLAAETEPVSKLEAACALLALSGELSAESQLERILDVGEEIMRASYGESSLMSACSDGYHPSTELIRWLPRETDSGSKTYYHYSTKVIDLASNLPAEILARRLSQAVLDGSDPRAGFAASLLQYTAFSQIEAVPAAVEVVIKSLDVPLRGLDRSAVCLLVRSRYAGKTSGEERKSCLSQLHKLASLLLEASPGGLRDRMRESLLDVASTVYGPDWSSDLSETLARIVLDQIVEKQENAPKGFHLIGPFTGWRTPYAKAVIDATRNAMRHFLDAWVKVANAYLEEHRHGPADAKVLRVVTSLDVVLQLYSDGDAWPVEETGILLTHFLHKYYTDDQDDTTDQSAGELVSGMQSVLLTQIVRITGQIPEFVRAQRQRSAQAVRKLKKFEAFLNDETDSSQFDRQGQSVPQLLDEAPYEGIRLCVGKNKLPPGTHIVVHGALCPATPTELLCRISSLNEDRNNRRSLPADPLLILAALADLTGDSTGQDQRIATLFTEDQRAKIFRQHLEDLFSSSLKARAIALHLLQRMAASSKSEQLTRALRDLLPPAADGAGTPKTRDGD